MALFNILKLIAANGGVVLTNSQQIDFTTTQVNQAWKEIWDQNDPVGSLREQVYNVDIPTGNQISLRQYVGVLRAVRYYYPQLNLRLKTSAPRYTAKFWQVKDFLSWEMKGDRCLETDIKNEGVLTFTFKAPLTVPVTISIIGSSTTASQLVESISFAEGDQQKSSINSYNWLDALTKDVICNVDCVVSDVDGNVLAEITNGQFKSLYQLVQIVNLPNNQSNNSSNFIPASKFVEVLWKLRFRPFQNPQDEALVPGYDDAIFWKYMENRALLDSTQNPTLETQATAYATKCDKILKDIAQNASQSADMQMQFGENPTLEAFTYIQASRGSYMYPYGVDGNGSTGYCNGY